MKVILLADIKGVGKKDEVINAADGHARNYLFPKKLAVEASKENMAKLEAQKNAVVRRKQKDVEDALALKEKMEGKIIRISVKKGESGRLFGSVTNKEIAEALAQQEGLQIDRKRIILDEVIKTIGQKQVDIKLYTDVTARITIEVE
ncbi:MAG: 50S ribosomal protein L9 [Defluviitaleaceae bacterium]|nr:50S ribosomal protein L9 [Defluviitaleaceae bacterium]MCL2836249.1 50S ribosomal protein L9 [Defluviitaleaceae bacterium]